MQEIIIASLAAVMILALGIFGGALFSHRERKRSRNEILEGIETELKYLALLPVIKDALLSLAANQIRAVASLDRIAQHVKLSAEQPPAANFDPKEYARGLEEVSKMIDEQTLGTGMHTKDFL